MAEDEDFFSGRGPPLFLDHPNFHHSSFNIESLELPELLKNQHVRSLFSSFKTMSDQLAESNKCQQKLYQEFIQIKDELSDMKLRRSQGVEGGASMTERFHRRNASQSTSELSPSDSASQLGQQLVADPAQFRHQPATRPRQYPHEIFWTLEDCQNDTDMDLNFNNVSCPPMDRAVRNANGTLITLGEWNAIKSSANHVMQEYLDPLPLKRSNMKLSKSYYRSFYPAKWMEAIHALEDRQPLLNLCTANWKAEHVLSNSIRGGTDAKNRKGKGKQKNSADNMELPGFKSNLDILDVPDEPVSKAKRRRSSTSASREKKKGKSKQTTDSTTSTTGKASALSEHLSLAKDADESSLTTSPSAAQPVPKFGGAGILPDAKGTKDRMDVDVDFIHVNPSFKCLKDTFKQEFPLIAHASELLEAMEADPTFKKGPPSSEMEAFILRIDTTNPNSPDLQEDDANASWGHYQFTAGVMSCTSVIKNWEAVGSTNVACQLIAAAIKTCKVSRHMCFERNIDSSSYLSDVYLGSVVEMLWNAWNAEHIPVSSDVHTPADENTHIEPPSESDGTDPRKYIRQLLVQELKKWMKDHGVAGTGKKDELINAILSDSAMPTPSPTDVANILSTRKKKQSKT